MWTNKAPQQEDISLTLKSKHNGFQQCTCSHADEPPVRRVECGYLGCLCEERALETSGNMILERPRDHKMPVGGICESMALLCGAHILLASCWGQEIKERSHRQTGDCQVLHLDLGLNSRFPPSCLPPVSAFRGNQGVTGGSALIRIFESLKWEKFTEGRGYREFKESAASHGEY